MWVVLRGHRATGKSSFLKRIQSYFPQSLAFDLDQELEKRNSLSIANYVEKFGWSDFRSKEIETFEDILKTHTETVAKRLGFICLGGGFEGELPSESLVVMIGRASDNEGRIDFERPALSDGNALQDSLSAFKSRHEKYLKDSDLYIEMPEGFDFISDEEFRFFAKLFSGFTTKAHLSKNVCKPGLPSNTNDTFSVNEGGPSKSLMQISGFKSTGECFIYPMSKAELLRLESKAWLVELYKNLPIDLFELRSDIFTLTEMQELEKILGDSSCLFSFRGKLGLNDFMDAFKDKFVDLDAQYVNAELIKHTDVISLHPKGITPTDLEPLVKAQALTKDQDVFFKIAAPVESWTQLGVLLDLAQSFAHPTSVFPISPSDKDFSSFRKLMFGRQKLHFFANMFKPEFADQPCLYETSLVRNKDLTHAVLGSPIKHSRSPALHFSRLAESSAAMIDVDCQITELGACIELLVKLSCTNFAITSPLKQSAFELLDSLQQSKISLGSVNTLSVCSGALKGTNTDLLGLQKFLSDTDLASKAALIWGGGGTLEMLKICFPDALSFSARTMKPREASGDHRWIQGQNLSLTEMLDSPGGYAPEVLVWAIANHDIEKGARVPPRIKGLGVVFDLGYKDSSLAKLYAKECDANYINGLEFLKLQAQYQVEFWNECK